MVYNNWFASQLDIPVGTLEKLVEIPNIIALKENSCLIEKWDELCMKLGDKISIVAGNGDIHEPFATLLGSKGIISGLANFIPNKLLAIYQACLNGDFIKARKLHREVLPLAFSYKYKDSSCYIAYLKEFMNLMDIPAGPARLPIAEIPYNEKEKVKKMAKEFKLV
jgi:dihydrodipicolinate synthase/N-acetylneuraminate lyase